MDAEKKIETLGFTSEEAVIRIPVDEVHRLVAATYGHHNRVRSAFAFREEMPEITEPARQLAEYFLELSEAMGSLAVSQTEENEQAEEPDTEPHKEEVEDHKKSFLDKLGFVKPDAEPVSEGTGYLAVGLPARKMIDSMYYGKFNGSW